MSDYKSFRLLLREDVYREWYRYFGSYGIRQTILRRVVEMMIHKAKLKVNIPTTCPLWMDKDCFKDLPFDKAIEILIDNLIGGMEK
jgi:hypothetical protein